MSIDYISHKCYCATPQLGVIDGDNDVVYCGICEGILGDLCDVRLASDRVHEEWCMCRECCCKNDMCTHLDE